MSKQKQRQWLVKVECKIVKMVTCANCTEEEARESPFEHAIDEFEDSQIDYEVISVEPDE